MSSKPELNSIRHSLAHVMAAVVQKLHPEAKFGVGPVVENGFYYDITVDHSFSTEDLKKIQKEMKKLISGKHEFVREEWPIDEAIKYFKAQKQEFKVELLNDLKTKGSTAISDNGDEELVDKTVDKVTTVSVYKTADFTDLCRGPHVKYTAELPVDGFKLTKVSGAYWRGNENNPQMQRIYGVAFESKAELDKYLEMLTEAERRDHRKLGKELDLFTFSDLIGPGLPLWTPRGTILRKQLDGFVQEMRDEYGFEEVAIPHITKKDAYITSGHWEKFEHELFKIHSREGHEFAMKPMNCPHHTQIFDSKPRSYRDMPVRYRETTMVYRDEQSGELHGLSRVRSITQDDAHVFCRPNQVEDEVMKVWDIIARFWKVFGIDDLKVRLSAHDPKDMESYLGTEKQWKSAEDQLRSVIKGQKVEFVEAPGDAAFYGPKIDFIGSDALGREFQASTIQLDFNMPARFSLSCTDEEGKDETVVMIHCAINGSLERSLVLLIEHFAGAFPLWLAPEQVRVIPVADRFAEYGAKVLAELKEAGLRATIDDASDSLGKRIRNAELLKVPYVLVVGEKEQKDGTVAVRAYSKGDQGTQKISEFTENAKKQVKTRSLK